MDGNHFQPEEKFSKLAMIAAFGRTAPCTLVPVPLTPKLVTDVPNLWHGGAIPSFLQTAYDLS